MSHAYKLKWSFLSKSIDNSSSDSQAYVHAQPLKLYQHGTNTTFIFQQDV